MAYLKVIEGSIPGQVVELAGDQSVIGRHPSCQVVLDHAAVSRHHAQILLSHGRYYLEDLRSRNGTFLNGEPIGSRTELNDGDEIQVCEVVLNFYRNYPPSSQELEEEDFAIGPARGAPPAPQQTRINVPIPAAALDRPASEGSSIISTIESQEGSFDSDFRVSVNADTKLRGVLAIARALSGILDVDRALDATLQALFRIFPQADEGFALLRDEGSDEDRVHAHCTRRDRPTGRVSRTIVRQAIDSRAAILSEDVQRDSRFDASESLMGMALRSVMCVPLLDADGQPLGVLQLDSHSAARHFTKEDLDLLAVVAGQAALAIDNARMHSHMLEQRELQRDLEYATQIQLGFLPHERPRIDGYEFFDFYEAAQSVGGDYFDYVPLPRGRLAISLGDVAGKGVPAALLMARLYSATRYHLLTNSNVADALQGLNQEFATGGVGHRFVTSLLTVLDPKSHQLRLANAGHLPPILRTASREVRLVAPDRSGLPIGVEPQAKYRQTEVALQPGDTLLYYTDGATEVFNRQDELFGTQRLMQAAAEGPDSPEELVRHILDRIEEFSGLETFRDDICLVCFRRS